VELKLLPVGNETKDIYVTYKGQPQKVKIKYIKESIKVCNECAHPEVSSYYNEIADEKITGTYTILYRENQYELTYTRLSDRQAFVFKGSSKPELCTW
jgi:hypothetical protein